MVAIVRRFGLSARRAVRRDGWIRAQHALEWKVPSLRRSLGGSRLHERRSAFWTFAQCRERSKDNRNRSNPRREPEPSKHALDAIGLR